MIYYPKMNLNEKSKIRIDKYIESQPDAKTDERFPISLKGQKKLLDVYSLPTDMLFYNIKNGRFAAEYSEKIKQEGGHLDPENKDDEKEIKKLLLEINPGETQRTYDDLNIRGQWNCGIITQDGYLIDGNRRKAIISKLYEETGKETWKYMDVARINGPINPEDLWALEAGIQLGKDEIVRYGPINELLKIREGKDAGLSEKAIVNALYGYDKEKEIHVKIDRLELIEQYLDFINKPRQYSKAKHNVEHFINLQEIIKACKEMEYAPDQIVHIKHATFQLIAEGVSHLDIRKINQMIKKDLTEAVSEIEDITKNPIIDTQSDSVDRTDEEELFSPVKTRLLNAIDILDVNNAEGKEIRLLHRAETNLKALADYHGDGLSTSEAKNLIEKINSYMKKITENIMRKNHDS